MPRFKLTTGLWLNMRWMIRRDIDEVLAIERHSFAEPWTEAELLAYLRRRECIAMIVSEEINDNDAAGPIVGYAIYTLSRETMRVARLAVNRASRRQSIGRFMLATLAAKLDPRRRRRITLDVPEDNLDAQLWLQKCRFTCTGLDEFDGRTVYRFSFSVESPDPIVTVSLSARTERLTENQYADPPPPEPDS